MSVSNSWYTSPRSPRTDGGSFAPAEASQEFFTYLAAQSVVLSAGPRIMNTKAAQLEVPRILSSAGVAWTSEGAEISPTSPDADVMVAVPRKIAAIVPFSNELLADSSPSVLAAVSQDLARAMALKLDLGLLNGSGTAPEIRGMAQASGIGTIAVNTDIEDLDPYIQAIGQVAAANGRASAIFVSAREYSALLRMRQNATDSNVPLLTSLSGAVSDGVTLGILGVPIFPTSQLPTDLGDGDNESFALVADMSQVVVVQRSDLVIATDESVYFTADSTAVRVTMRYDLLLPNPEAVVKLSGIGRPAGSS